MSNVNITLTEKELKTAISGLLFSCSVNVVSNTNKDFQLELLDLAKKLKDINPDVKLENVQFLREENYEDETSEGILETFKNNIEVITFEQI